MKKFNIFVTLCLTLISGLTIAQDNNYTLFHKDKEINAGVKYGLGGNSQSINVTGEYLKTNAFGYTFDLSYDFNTPNAFQYTDFRHYRLSGGILYNPLNNLISKRLFWHLKLQLLVGSETVSSRVEDYAESQFIFGVSAGTALDWYVSRKLILTCGFNEYYTYNALIGNLHWEANLGLKFIL